MSPANAAARTGRVLHVACDGSALRNPHGPGGWAWFVSQHHWQAGNSPQASNNQMELLGLLRFLETIETVGLPLATPIVVHVDSQYVVDSVTQWFRGWRKNGWRTKNGSPVKNRDLLIEVRKILDRRPTITIRWVRGHAGHDLNEAADRLARAAATAAANKEPCDEGPGWSSKARNAQKLLSWPPTLAADELYAATLLHVGGGVAGGNGWWGWGRVGGRPKQGMRQFASAAEAQLFAVLSALRQVDAGEPLRLLVPKTLLLYFTPTPPVATKAEDTLVSEVAATLKKRSGGWSVSTEMFPLPYGSSSSSR